LTRVDDDNRSDQLNPNNDAYWRSRGHDGRPDDWERRSSNVDAWADDWGDDEHPASPESEKDRLLLEEARREETNEAKKEIATIEKEAFEVSEEILEALFNAYDLTLKLDRLRGKSYSITRQYEDLNLSFRDPILMGNLRNHLRVFLERNFPLSVIERYPPETPLRDKIISKIEEYGIYPV